MPTLAPIDELARLANNATPSIDRALLRLAQAILSGDPDERRAAQLSVQREIAETAAIASLLGRRRALIASGLNRPTPSPEQFAAQIQDKVKRVPFEEAIADIVQRTPRLADDAAGVAAILTRDPRAIAFARSADLTLTTRVQQVLARFAREGTPLPKAKRVLSELAGFTRAYSETVYRTNLNKAYTQGLMTKVADPEVRDVAPALEFNAVGDANTRANHQKADGVIASTTDPIWNTLAPPLGFNCRCSLRVVSKFELREKFGARGLPAATIPPGAGPDPGFR